MKHLRGIWINVLVAILMTVTAALAIPNVTGFTTRNTGETITATIWNNELGGLYTYINNNLVTALNLVATKGALLTHNGSALVGLPAGANGLFLKADDTQAAGLIWAAVASVTELTTKGDLLVHNGSANVRMGTGGAGNDGKVLTARASESTGLAWEAAGGVPAGVIAIWSGSIATIPTGWALCDGNSGRPNLQGLFVIGAGNGTPAASGFGLLNPAATGGSTTHTHTSGTLETGSPNQASQASLGSGSARSQNHTHNVNGDTGSTSTAPAYYALAYIQKLFLWLFPALRRRRIYAPAH